MDNINNFLRESRAKKENSGINLPRVVTAKRLKFYKAIGKDDLIVVDKSEVKSDDENLSLECLFWEPLLKKIQVSHTFDDSVVIAEFNKLKHPQFNLKEYIKAVKWVYFNWLDVDGTNSKVSSFDMYETLKYLLAHARDFNEPSKNLYIFPEVCTKEIKRGEDDDFVKKKLPGNTKYITNLNKLIADLQDRYDEKKYQQLNLNVTYLILLLARRIVKSEDEFNRALLLNKTHEDFAALCPNPLDSRLPILGKLKTFDFDMLKDKSLNIFIFYGYQSSKGKTRKIFRQTCINYMEYNGLGLVKLFYDVVQLYSIEDYKLWDIMSKYEDCCQALFTLADLAHLQNEFTNSDPPKTYKLFPFCRLFKQHYHSNLSNKQHQNFIACYALAFLVDLKLGPTKSFARKAHWTKAFSNIWQGKGVNIARDIYKKIYNYEVGCG